MNENVFFFVVFASDLTALPELTVLEIRGSVGRRIQFYMDEPLPQLQYANFEAIELIGTEETHKNQHPVHPSEVFDYVPESEQIHYNVSLEVNEEVEIVPYDVYVMEIMEKKKFKMPSFYGWKDLNILRINRCKFEDELHWEMFDGLHNLEHLFLQENDIKLIPPFAFYGAMHIKTLTLARNSILDFNYRALAGLLELEVLDVSHNNLTKLSEISFPPFPRLQTVDFRNNPIRFIFPMTFGVMNSTKQILIGSDVGALDLSLGNSFRTLGAIQNLVIENGTAAVLNQYIFKDMNKLASLRIHGDIKRIEFDAFAEMPSLRDLILSNCRIEEISMDIFFGVRNLEIVDLSDNKLKSLPPGLFDEQLKIKEVYLQRNQLTILPKDFFLNIASLKLLR